MSEKESSMAVQQGEKVVDNTTLRMRTYALIRTLLIGFLGASLINGLFSYIFYTPKANRININNIELVEKYKLLESQIEAMEHTLNQISHRDNTVYRTLLGADTLPYSTPTLPYPKYTYTSLEGDPYSPIMMSTWEKIDILAKDLYRQSKSLDELESLAADRKEFSVAIPAIWPIDRTALKYIGAFGMRLHPIYRRYIMHKGIDLACDTGTPIYATGDAVVQSSQLGYRRSGYGQMLLLRHKFGYQTRYAHLSKRLVNVGDTVRRGDLIGLVGSTGGSTGPHLHYEVIVRGEVVNPLNFFDRNMSKEEYEKLMEQVHDTNLERIEEDPHGEE